MTIRLARPTIVWLLLILATTISFESSLGVFSDHRIATSAILAVAFLKVRAVALEFMELRHAPLIFRIGVEVWAVAVFAAMASVYWLGPN